MQSGIRDAADYNILATHVMDVSSAAEALARNPEWVLVEDDDGNVLCLLKADDLARHLRTTNEKEAYLMHLSAERKATLGIDVDATLRDARELFARSGVEMLYVRCTASGTSTVGGVLTRSAVDALAETPSQRGSG